MEIQTSGRPIESLLEKVLSMNILSSDYFKELYRLKTYHEVIDEIYNQVDHVEPWMTGNCRGPSTAFCLLYKFFTMKLTVKQMHGLLKHADSPYIRAVCRGFWHVLPPHLGCDIILYSVWCVFLCMLFLLVCVWVSFSPFLLSLGPGEFILTFIIRHLVYQEKINASETIWWDYTGFIVCCIIYITSESQLSVLVDFVELSNAR